MSDQQPVSRVGRDPLKELYTDWSEILATTPDLTVRLFRSIFDEWHQPTTEPTDVTYAEESIGGVPGIWCRPNGADASRVLLYTHGGGFAVGSASSHRKLAGHFAKALGVPSFVLDYRRAPEHPHPASLDDAVSAFLALTEGGIAPGNITTIGDSAGGNLAVATALALAERGQPVPGSVIALSPWLDMENKGETLVTNDATDPIEEITPRGVRTADGVEHELDVLVFATGFDAVDGNYRSMDLRGRGGQHIDEHWDQAPTSYLGVTTAGFPNMFMILGPNGPFTNLPPSIETQVEFITDLIQGAERKGGAVVEATAEAEDGWTATCDEIAHMTLFPKAASWIFGANIPGKKNAVMFFMGGLANYRAALGDVQSDDFKGFRFTKAADRAAR